MHMRMHNASHKTLYLYFTILCIILILYGTEDKDDLCRGSRGNHSQLEWILQERDSLLYFLLLKTWITFPGQQ